MLSKELEDGRAPPTSRGPFSVGLCCLKRKKHGLEIRALVRSTSRSREIHQLRPFGRTIVGLSTVVSSALRRKAYLLPIPQGGSRGVGDTYYDER